MKGIPIDDLPERYRRQVERQLALPHRPSVPATNMEPPAGSKPVAKTRYPKVDTPCRISVLCRRHRLADPDGISVKAVLDSIVFAGILADDSAKEIVESPTVKQVKIPSNEPEETIVEIYKV